MERPRLALVTYSGLRSSETDDAPLVVALTARGCAVEHPVWDDPAVDWGRYAGVLIRTTWDYQDKREQFVRWAVEVEAVSRLFNPAALVAWNTHKSYLRELAERGVALAPSVWFDAGEQVELGAVVAERGIRRGFLKPLVGASASDTLRFHCDRPGELAAAQAHLDEVVLKRGEGMVLQPYLERVEREGELSAIYFDGEFSHAVIKIPVSGDYRVQDDFGAYDGPCELDAEARAVAERTLAATEAVAARMEPRPTFPLLYARVDLLRDQGGGWVLNELELVEPSLFFRHAPEAAAGRLADALLGRVGRPATTSGA